MHMYIMERFSNSFMFEMKTIQLSCLYKVSRYRCASSRALTTSDFFNTKASLMSFYVQIDDSLVSTDDITISCL